MFSELLREVTDWSVFTESVQQYISELSLNSIIVTIMMIFMFLGAIARPRATSGAMERPLTRAFSPWARWPSPWWASLPPRRC